MDLNLGLTVTGSGEDLTAAGWDRCVALNLWCGDSAQRFDRESEWTHVEEKNILHFSTEHTCLDRGADGDHLIRVDALMRFLAKEGANTILHCGHACHPTNH